MNERIKELRKINGLSQEKFGEKLGVTKAAISRMELGTYNVTDTMIMLICKTYHINEEWLRTGKGEIYKTTDNLVELFAYKIDELKGDEQQLLINFLSMDEKDRQDTLRLARKLFAQSNQGD